MNLPVQKPQSASDDQPAHSRRRTETVAHSHQIRSPNMPKFAVVLTLVASFIGIDSTAICNDRDLNFDRDVAPLLIDRCLDCHSGSQPEAGLNLTGRSSTLKGGDSGSVVEPGNASDSLLWQRIEADEMPPKHPLSKEEKEIVRRWIQSGAAWGTDPIDPFRQTTSRRAGYDWWALQPIERPQVPKPSPAGAQNEIDAFVRAKLTEHNLPPSPPASDRELIRRLYFDLIGLPPNPGQVANFLQQAEIDRQQAVEDAVEQLLDSKHFGERWGRHWLDVVRFGESQGFERDKIRDNSWHYRDWVIDAFNQDLPYDEFVRLQLAGDVLHPHDSDAITATGFLVAGPWDEVGQSQRSTAMKAVVRQDEIEDYVGTISQTFLGLTVNCARCHDHKFDPIRQSEYYQLAAAVGGVHHGSRNVVSPADRQAAAQITTQIKDAQTQLANLSKSVRERLWQQQSDQPLNLPTRPAPIARWEFEGNLQDVIGEAHATRHSKAQVNEGRLLLDHGTGYARTDPVPFDLHEKTLEAWVQLDNLDQRAGAAICVHSTTNQFDAIVFAEREPRKWMAGSDFFRRTKNLDAPTEELAHEQFVHVAISYHADGTIACFRNGQPYGMPYHGGDVQDFKAGEWFVQFGLRTGGPAAARQLQAQVEAAQLYDVALTAEQVQASYEIEKHAITFPKVLEAMRDNERILRDQLLADIADLQKTRQQHQPYSVYVAAPQQPDVTHVLHRGNPATKGDQVGPGGIASLNGVPKFGLAADVSDAQRRIALARWITDRNNPLFARVIVNRLWHYHFGQGLVTTPNDFGFNGGRPSHPELLDWLASELIDNDWKLKHIHQLIVTSATWQQSSRFRAECASVDADNRLLWRRDPQRLEAEALRDAMLSVSGQLNDQYGGPPYRDFETFTSNSQFYEIKDFDDPDVYRRTVYRTWVRSGRNPFLDVFDCPDPSTTSPNRAVTTTPIQALSLLNNSFVLRMSDRMAQRIVQDVGSNTEAQIQRLFQLAVCRPATAEEIESLAGFVEQHGLAALCRIILNSNEFIYVD
ncbi:MAG: hypothetical protein Fues2KO_35240 [Fuerstiella sp.]